MDETTTNTAPDSAQPPLGLFARLIGVVTSPRATFERVAAAPRIAAVMILMSLLIGVATGAFLVTPQGQQAWLDQQVQITEQFTKQPMPPERYATMEKMAPFVGYGTVGGTLVFAPIIFAIEAGILYVIFTFGTGGTATFKQVLNIVILSSVIGVLGLCFNAIMQFARGTISMTGPANLGVLLPMLADNGFLAKFLGFIDLFRVWQVMTISMGLSVLYKKKTMSIALVLFGIYALIAGGFAAFLSR
jgi:hypothetical protein